MKKLLKLCSVILCVAMLVSALAGCGGNDETNDGVITLRWYIPQVDCADRMLVQEEINKILAKDGLAIEWLFVDAGNYDEKMQMANAGGEVYDLCFTSNWRNDFYNNVANGAMYDITDLLPVHAPKLWASMDERIWNVAKVDGKIYAAPNWQIQTKGVSIGMPQELLDKSGCELENIKTFEDVEHYMKELQKVEPESNMIRNYWDMIQFYYGFVPIGNTVLPGVIRYETDEWSTVINQYDSPEFEEFVRMTRRWVEEGVLTSNYYTQEDYNNFAKTDPFKEPFRIFTTSPTAGALLKNNTGYDWAITEISKPILCTDGVNCAMTGVSATSKHPEEAVKLLELMNNNKELINLITYGLEGKHYNKVSENRIERIKNSGYTGPQTWMVASSELLYLQGIEKDDNWEKTREINDNAYVVPTLGFVPDTSMITAELANCQTVINEQLEMLVFGLIPVDEGLANLRKGLDDAGADIVIAEYQKQLDEWVAATK